MVGMEVLRGGRCVGVYVCVCVRARVCVCVYCYVASDNDMDTHVGPEAELEGGEEPVISTVCVSVCVCVCVRVCVRTYSSPPITVSSHRFTVLSLHNILLSRRSCAS